MFLYIFPIHFPCFYMKKFMAIVKGKMGRIHFKKDISITYVAWKFFYYFLQGTGMVFVKNMPISKTNLQRIEKMFYKTFYKTDGF